MVLVLKCSCGWTYTKDNNDPEGRRLGILKGIHEMTFTGHVCKIEKG